MAQLRSSKPPKQVSTLTHDDATRRNIPTAELQSTAEYLEEMNPPEPVAYPRARPLAQGEKRERDEDLDPQIVWNGARIRLTKTQIEQLAETGEVEIGDAQLVWRGKDNRNALTVEALTDLYLEQGPALKPNKKDSSWETNRIMFDCHINPLLGRHLARDVTAMDVSRMQLDISQGKTARNIMLGHRRRSKVRGGKRVAAMAVITLGAVYEFAIKAEYLQKNPTKGVERFKTIRKERYLSEREIAALAEALAEFEREDERYAVMADSVRLLMLTGCRKSEILTLQWDFIDWSKGCLRLPESKTGAKVVPLADDAIAVLRRRWNETRAPEASRGHNSGDTTPAIGAGSPWVLPALKGDGHFVGLPNLWTKVKARADAILHRRIHDLGGDLREVRSLTTVRLHDLRHSFASFAIADGASLFLVGKVLGHKQARTTEIYAHLSDDPLKLVANKTAARLSQAMRF